MTLSMVVFFFHPHLKSLIVAIGLAIDCPFDVRILARPLSK